jgi:CPA2 family monovalent cation:H+ antiporter-2
VTLGLLPVEGQNLILAGALISIAVNPLVFKAVEPVQAWIRSRSTLAQMFERAARRPVGRAAHVYRSKICFQAGRLGRLWSGGSADR